VIGTDPYCGAYFYRLLNFRRLVRRDEHRAANFLGFLKFCARPLFRRI
jgi:hypothetical protein